MLVKRNGSAIVMDARKNCNKKMRLRGIEPPHAAPEATALSTELQTHLHYHTTFYIKLQGFYFAGFELKFTCNALLFRIQFDKINKTLK